MQIGSWNQILTNEKKQPYFIKILNAITAERNSGIVIYPPQKDIFNVFRFTAFNNIKVVILGQDPYYKVGQAHGLAFSVLPGVAIPPSLLNIYKELEYSIPYFISPAHGYLESWARQGVMLLNTILTVRSGSACSHANLGWEIFTDKIIKIINECNEGLIFLLWGSHAQKKEKMIDKKRHYVWKAPHPSPLSAHRGFLGCNHFVLANQLLKQLGKQPINWLPMLINN